MMTSHNNNASNNRLLTMHMLLLNILTLEKNNVVRICLSFHILSDQYRHNIPTAAG